MEKVFKLTFINKLNEKVVFYAPFYDGLCPEKYCKEILKTDSTYISYEPPVEYVKKISHQ